MKVFMQMNYLPLFYLTLSLHFMLGMHYISAYLCIPRAFHYYYNKWQIYRSICARLPFTYQHCIV